LVRTCIYDFGSKTLSNPWSMHMKRDCCYSGP
jgi:hypothetical protein